MITNANPVEHLQQLTGAHFIARSLHVAAELGLADALGEAPMPVTELAAAARCNADALHRMLRLLSSYGVFSLANGSVAHTEVSRFLRSDHPASFRDFVRMIGLPTNWRVLEELEHSIRTGEPGLARTLPEGFWAHFEKHPEQARIFDAAMAAKARAHIGAVLASFDFSPYHTIVDVGGGRGHLLHAIVEAAPGARGVLFDLPHVADAARAAVSHPRLQFQGGDFFRDPLPPGDCYLLMEVLHDWTDDQCGQILDAVRAAALDGARLLVIETVPPSGPEPAWAKMLDLLMLSLFAGKQRTRDEYDVLLARHRFRLSREIDTGAGISVFEAAAV